MYRTTYTDLDNVTVIHLDHLSQMTDDTLEKRKESVPQAEVIIEEVKEEFIKWLETTKVCSCHQGS